MSTVKSIRTQREFDELEPVWRELLKADPHHTIFQTCAWQYSWWNNLSRDHALYVLVITDADRPIGIAPLMISRGAQRTVRFIGTPNVDYADVIGGEKSRIVEATLDYLMDHTSEWKTLELSQIPETTPTLNALHNLLDKRQLTHLIRPTEKCMAYIYDGDDAGREGFTIKRNKTLRNYINFFEKTGGMTLERLHDTSRILAWLPRLFHSHIVRWTPSSVDSKFHDVEHRQFYRQLAQSLAPRDVLDLLVLKHGETPLAYLLAYRYGGKIHLYTISNEPYYQRKSPGIVILHLLIEQYVRDGFSEIDFSRGAGTHKDRFITDAVQNYEVLVLSRPSTLRKIQRRERLKSSKLISALWQFPFMQSVKESLTQAGVSAYLRTILKRIGRFLIDSRKTIRFIDSDRSISGGTTSDGFPIESVSIDAIEEIAAFCGFVCDSPEHKTMQSNLAAGDELLAARIDGIMAALVRVRTRGEAEYYGCRFAVGEGEVVLDDLVVSPVFERPTLAKEFLDGVRDVLRRKNLRAVILCDGRDLKRRELIDKAGMEIASSKRYLRLLGIRIL